MTRYWVTMGILALAVGALWRAVSLYHIPLLEMAGTIGIFLLGLIGSLALTRQQTLTGRKAVENVLTGLGPLYVITDWSEGSGPAGAPDYLILAPAGIIAITVDHMPDWTRGRKLAARLEQARERAHRAGKWVSERLPGTAPDAAAPLQSVLVFTRKRVDGSESREDLPVLNAEHLRELMGQLVTPERLTAAQRVEITRHLRQKAAQESGRTRR